WPSHLNMLITLLIFVLTSMDPHSTVQIHTNNLSLVDLVNFVQSVQSYNYFTLDKQQYTYLLLALKAIIYDQTITITLNKELQIQETQLNIFPLDSEPQKFL